MNIATYQTTPEVNECDYITCRIEEEKEIRSKTIEECINDFADWFGHNYQNQGYYRLLKQKMETK